MNASDEREVTEFGKVRARLRPEQYQNALLPIEVTEDGMVSVPEKL